METFRFNEYGELRKEILLVILVNSIFGFAVGFTVPSVAPLIVFMNVTMTFVGNIRSTAQTIGSLIRPLLGPLVDRYGPKTFYLLGGMITTIGHLFYALTESWVLLAAGLLLTNLDLSMRGLSSTVAIGKGSDTKTRGKAFSLDLGINQLAARAGQVPRNNGKDYGGDDSQGGSCQHPSCRIDIRCDKLRCGSRRKDRRDDRGIC